MKGLIIDEPWVSMIVNGEKTWEMRSRDTKVRGRIGLIRKGSKTVIGVADLVGTVPKLSRADLRANVAKHQVRDSGVNESSNTTRPGCSCALGRYPSRFHTATLPVPSFGSISIPRW